MAMVAADAPREEKQEWLMRPFNWAYSVAWFSMCFGAVFWFYGLAPAGQIVAVLVVACAAIFALLLWGFRRLHLATGGN